jgi:hypothetical protein
MTNKISKKEIIKDKLLQDREVSNYWCIKNGVTTRLAAFIHLLKGEGMNISSKMQGNDCVYSLPKETLF